MWVAVWLPQSFSVASLLVPPYRGREDIASPSQKNGVPLSQRQLNVRGFRGLPPFTGCFCKQPDRGFQFCAGRCGNMLAAWELSVVLLLLLLLQSL